MNIYIGVQINGRVFIQLCKNIGVCACIRVDISMILCIYTCIRVDISTDWCKNMPADTDKCKAGGVNIHVEL